MILYYTIHNYIILYHIIYHIISYYIILYYIIYVCLCVWLCLQHVYIFMFKSAKSWSCNPSGNCILHKLTLLSRESACKIMTALWRHCAKALLIHARHSFCQPPEAQKAFAPIEEPSYKKSETSIVQGPLVENTWKTKQHNEPLWNWWGQPFAQCLSW